MKGIKAILAIVVAAALALVTALGTGSSDVGDIDAQHWIIAALFVLGSGGIVYFTTNGPAAPAIKTIVAFLTAGLASIELALDDHVITQAEWLTAFVAAIVATGLVYEATDKSLPPNGGAVSRVGSTVNVVGSSGSGVAGSSSGHGAGGGAGS